MKRSASHHSRLPLHYYLLFILSFFLFDFFLGGLSIFFRKLFFIDRLYAIFLYLKICFSSLLHTLYSSFLSLYGLSLLLLFSLSASSFSSFLPSSAQPAFLLFSSSYSSSSFSSSSFSSSPFPPFTTSLPVVETNQKQVKFTSTDKKVKKSGVFGHQ